MISATGPLPPYQPSSDPCVLLTNILSTLLRIEDYLRPADYLTAVPRTVTTGTGAAYAAADTYRFPLVAKSLSLILWHESVVIQIANDQNPEWSFLELPLRGPGVYAVPVFARGFRIRAADANYQATYSLVVTNGASPAIATPDWPIYNGASIVNSYHDYGIAPHDATVRWQYTVPTGRACLVTAAQTKIMRDGVPGAPGRASIRIVGPTANAAALLITDHIVVSSLLSGETGTMDAAEIGQSMILNETELFAGITSDDQSVGGSHEYIVNMLGVEYAPT